VQAREEERGRGSCVTCVVRLNRLGEGVRGKTGLEFEGGLSSN
jgi:hypothetical protein